MTEDQNSSYTNEMTLADVVVTGHRFVRESLRKWYVYVLAFLLVGGYMFYTVLTEPVTYQATVTLMRDDDESSGVSGMASILGQFGIGRRSAFNLDRVLELAKSRRIVSEMLFDSASIDGKGDYIANHLVIQYELDDQWKKKKPELEGFRFSRDSVDLFSDLELNALRRTYLFVVGNEDRPGLISADYSELSSIISLSATTVNEPLSIAMIKKLFATLTDYYVTSATQKQQMTYDIVKTKSDSIGALLALKEMEYARFRDENQGLYSNLAQLKAERLSRDILKLNTIHAEALKNVEIADFTLRNATPIIKELDMPVPPLKPIKASLVRTAAISVILTVLLGALWILGGWFISHIKSVLKNQN